MFVIRSFFIPIYYHYLTVMAKPTQLDVHTNAIEQN